MTRASKICSKPGCPHLMPCPVEGHTRKPWEGSNRRAELPGNWESLRRQVLDRDPICTVCGRALSQDCHHLGDKYDHSLGNLAGVCKKCHREITQAQAAEARRRITATE